MLHDKWYFIYGHQLVKFDRENENALVAGRVTGIDSTEQIMTRCIRIFKLPENNDHVSCVLCRAKFILGFSLFMGLSVPQHFNNYVVTTGKGPVHSRSTWFNELMIVIFTSPPTVAAVVSMFLDRNLGYNHKDVRKDGGRHWWGKFKYFERNARSAEFYSLFYGLSK
ncbi:hypothetical protein L1987_81173 [Smallanthus sonchifolius]|uniref:Uncharacterized protein n=1 Tax=Smallanthus sonchifolius TaxID=185202 RepID=A0ACB8YQU5_9ASTR|nr:hypothetical protein L1987_81173 [Smallanthus sonchifolius]